MSGVDLGDLDAKIPPSPSMHYAIFHRTLPDAFFRHPENTLHGLSGDRAGEVLGRAWREAMRECRDSRGPLPIRPVAESSGREWPHVEIRSAKVRAFEGVLVVPPPPRGPPEVYLVAMVCAEEGRPRYLTLECAMPGPAAPGTFLCEWKGDGAHINLGDGPPPTADGFLWAVARRFEEERILAGESAESAEPHLSAETVLVKLPGPLTFEEVTLGDLLEDLASGTSDFDVTRVAYFADPEKYVPRPWQMEVLCALEDAAMPALVRALEERRHRRWALLALAARAKALPADAIAALGRILEEGDDDERDLATRAIDGQEEVGE